MSDEKPEAMRFDGTKESANEILAWVGASDGNARRANGQRPAAGLLIDTPGGVMRANVGERVIRTMQGEFYVEQARA